MNSIASENSYMSTTFLCGCDSFPHWREPMGFIEDIISLLCGVKNQSQLASDTKLPQPNINRWVKAAKEGSVPNIELKNLGQLLDKMGYVLVEKGDAPKNPGACSELNVREKIAGELMDFLLEEPMRMQWKAYLVWTGINKIEGPADPVIP